LRHCDCGLEKKFREPTSGYICIRVP
jgi:hypothetical protein